MIQVDALPAIPWRNGGGATRNLAVEPEDAGFDDFLWRVSIAEVTQSGSFSQFPGVDRTIVLLSGDGMVLRSADGSQFALTTPFVPHDFPGETAMDATLTGSATRDFNVMTRRGHARAIVQVWRNGGIVSCDADQAVWYCAHGQYRFLGCAGSCRICAANAPGHGWRTPLRRNAGRDPDRRTDHVKRV